MMPLSQTNGGAIGEGEKAMKPLCCVKILPLLIDEQEEIQAEL